MEISAGDGMDDSNTSLLSRSGERSGSGSGSGSTCICCSNTREELEPMMECIHKLTRGFGNIMRLLEVLEQRVDRLESQIAATLYKLQGSGSPEAATDSARPL